LALAISLAVWYSVSLADRQNLAETTVDQAIVNYTVPRGYVMLDPDPVRNARVRLRGTDKKIRQLNPNLVKIQVELPEDAREKEISVTLGPDAVQVPDDFEVIGIDPNVIRVELDREVTQRVPVRVQTTGEPAAGAKVGEPEAYPNQVQVNGPESLVSQLEALSTRPVDLSGREASFEQTVSVMPPPDPRIQLVQPFRVLVRVPVESERAAGDGEGRGNRRNPEDS
jgi:YbbR domain-containing protein